jgi:hypothetical protein
MNHALAQIPAHVDLELKILDRRRRVMPDDSVNGGDAERREDLAAHAHADVVRGVKMDGA